MYYFYSCLLICPQLPRENFHISLSILILVGFPLLVMKTIHHSPSGSPQPTPDIRSQISGYAYFSAEGIATEQIMHADLYNAIYALRGTSHSSRAGSKGLDCSGFVKLVFYQAFQKKLRGGSADIFNVSAEVGLNDIREGDLVFFKIHSRQINHVGIYLNNSLFAHVSANAGVTLNQLTEDYYRQHFYSAGRVIATGQE